MTLENIKLDIDYVRSQFPAFKDPLSKDWSFFENAGGSYVPQNVINKSYYDTWQIVKDSIFGKSTLLKTISPGVVDTIDNESM